MGISAAGHRAGFGSARAIYEGAGRRLGMTPGVYRRGGGGAEIGYRVVNSRWGRVLIAWTPEGICSVVIGGKGAGLVEELRREFPRAKVERRAATPERWIAAVKRCGEEDAILAGMGAEIRRRVFEARLWNWAG